MNSGVSDTFVLGSTMAITSCVPDPCQVAGDLSTRLTWRIPECLHVDNLDILNDTCRLKGFLFGTPVSFSVFFERSCIGRYFYVMKQK